MTEITHLYQQTVSRIRKYAEKYGRDAGSIRLIAVSKRHSVNSILEVAASGHTEFGENYLQEAAEKIAAIESADTPYKLIWHFIGHIQSRKCRQVAELFDWVHTVDSLKLANRLNQFREGMPPLKVLVQLNLQQEDSKSGVGEDQLPELSDLLSRLPNLDYRGLMVIPKPVSDLERQREVFRNCRNVLERENSRGHQLDQLSMGMTDDMEAAIAEGATQIRIGTAIFGPRPEKQDYSNE